MNPDFPKINVINISEDKLELILQKYFKKISDRNLAIGVISADIRTMLILGVLMIVSKFSKSWTWKEITLGLTIYLVIKLLIDTIALKQYGDVNREQVLNEAKGKK